MEPPLLRCSGWVVGSPLSKFCAGPLPCDHRSDCAAYLSLDKNDDLRRACPNRSALIAPQPYMRWILVGSEAMMRSCASTARLLGGGAHSVFRHASHRSSRATATSDHLGIRRRETGLMAEICLLSSPVSAKSFMLPDAAPRRLAARRSSRIATVRSVAFEPRRRSWFCAHLAWRPLFALDTIARACCSSDA